MQENSKVKVLVVDGVSLTRFALNSLIRLHPLVSSVDEACTASQARSLCDKLKPDLIVVDIGISSGDGIDLLTQLRSLHPRQATLVVSEREDIQSIQRAFGVGARAYLSKADEPAEVLNAIESVITGGLYASPRISLQVLKDLARTGQRRFDRQLSNLSNRELHVFRTLGQGLGASKIARQLGVSVKTIESHQQRIKEKLRLKTAGDLHRAAERWAALVTSEAKPRFAKS